MSNRSEALFARARRLIPGGVNSPVRAFRSVDCDPPYIARGKGSKIFDVDGNAYTDYVCSWGPLILGHADDRIVGALKEYAELGTSFGANTEIEVRFAGLITEIFPSIEMVRMVNSGTEATMSALRLARGYTGRDLVVKFNGCYHGHSDSFLIKAGSGVLTLGIPGSPGVTADTARDTLVAEFNDIDSMQRLVEANRGRIAAVIVEPIMGNAGLIPPRDGFLQELRKLTDSEGILLIFDEVITGFRVALGGAQELYGVRPDLTCLGKIIGGGLPVGAFGGRKDIMERLAPVGPVYQAGTLSGNPLAMALGFQTVGILKNDDVYTRLEKSTSMLVEGIRENLKKLSIEGCVNRVGSLFTLFFTGGRVTTLSETLRCDVPLFKRYFHAMLKSGVYLPPSPFETAFVSAAHSDADIEATIAASYESLKTARSQGTS